MIILLLLFVTYYSTGIGNKLCIYYQNCGGLRTKLNTLYLNILSDNYDILVLTETWLIPSIADGELIDERYTVFRCDRDRVACGREDGGGVLVAVRTELCAARRILPPVAGPPDPLVDYVLLELPPSSGGPPLILFALYIPPGRPLDTYCSYLDPFRDLLIDQNIDNYFMLGDFNIPSLSWLQHGLVSKVTIDNDTSASGKYLVNYLTSINGLQYNSLKNSMDRTLDLFISNMNMCYCTPPPAPLSRVSDLHPPFYVLANLHLNTGSMGRKSVLKYAYTEGSYVDINNDILNIDWYHRLLPISAEMSVALFYEIIYEVIRKRIPLKSCKSSKFPIWFTRALIHIYNDKQKSWLKWKTYNNISDYEQFSLYRRRFKRECRECYRKYLNNIEDGIRNDVKQFWKYVHSRNNKTKIPDTVKYNNEESNDPTRICGMYSDFFKSVYEPSDLSSNTLVQSGSDTNPLASPISSVEITRDKVEKVLSHLDTCKGAGPDGIPPLFLKNTSSSICVPVSIIFNKCIDEGVFPTIWKTANITPIYKDGDKHNVENYRPISLLPALSKVFERLVHNEVYANLQGVLIAEQHGFVMNRSTVTNLLLYTNYLFESMDRGIQVDSVYTDFRKAFDRVDHTMLLRKLAYNGIRGNLLRWFQSYVTNRSQKVVINGFASEGIVVTSGVPQGSILGPLLFVLFINDIGSCIINSNFLLYADDLKIYRGIKVAEDCLKMQQDLDRLSEYCILNKLKLSLPKCKAICFTKNHNVVEFSYTIDHHKLDRVSEIRDLGLILDCRLHLDRYIDHITSKAYKLYGFVMRSCKEFTRPVSYIYIYSTLIRPQLEYATTIWNPYYKIYNDKIETVQRKFLRSVNFKFSRVRLSYEQLLDKYQLLPLHDRRSLHDSMLLYRLCHNVIDCVTLVNQICYLTPSASNRIRENYPHRLFVTGCTRTNAGLRAPLRRIVNTYNIDFSDIDLFAFTAAKFRRLILNKLKG